MKKRSGTTLLEIVLALSLASLLVAALGGVLRSMSRQNQSVGSDRMEDSRHGFNAMLWNDLSQAKTIASPDGGLVLEVPISSTDADGGTQIVSYEIRNSQKLPSRLQRTEVRATGLNRKEKSQTVFWRVDKIKFERIDRDGSSQPIPSSTSPSPLGIRYWLTLVGQDQPIEGEVNAR
jgi:type II secretory pathway pseudopilin PulG